MKRTIYFGLLSLLAVTFLAGCSTMHVLDPKGPIGGAERFVIIAAAVLMAIVVIPVFIMGFWFPLKYRASNTKSTYSPKWSHSTKIDLTMWAVPIAIVTVLGILSWTRTHALDPYKPIGSGDPIHVEVVALNWKYLFIYPDHRIASVNHFVFPVKVPVSFKLTSDTVMTSFFIPQLGSQIYAMAGMQTRLHLLADHPGTYSGHNQQFSGTNYADMFFTAKAVSPEEFQAWLQKAKQSPEKLDLERYKELAKPSAGYPVTYFSWVKPRLFEHIMSKYRPQRIEPPGPFSRRSVSTPTATDTSEGN